MSGDVIDLVKDDCSLTVPAWVPPAVAGFARHMLVPKITEHPEYEPILRRLLTDPRMRSVWAHLTARRRRDGSFKQAARFPGPDLMAVASERQDFALIYLLNMTLTYAASGTPALLRRDLNAARRDLRELAGKLREEAEVCALDEKVLGRDLLGDRIGRADKLDDAATVLEELAVERGYGYVVVERDRDSEAHGLAMQIARTCYGLLFGAPLYGVTATLTGVALARDVSRRRVREWWKAGPAEFRESWKACPPDGDE